MSLVDIVRRRTLLAARLTAVLVLIVAMVSGLSLASAQDEASVRRAALVFRILSYDRNLRERTSERVTVLVAYRDGDRRSEAESRGIVGALNALGRRTRIAGLPGRAIPHRFQGAGDLQRAVTRERAAAVYVCAGLSEAVSDISRVARSQDSLSLVGERALARRGLGVAIAAEEGTFKLIVNLRAVREEGARLDAALLRLAEILR